MRRRVYAPSKRSASRSKSRSLSVAARKRTKFYYPAKLAMPASIRPSPSTAAGQLFKAKLIYSEKDVTLNPAIASTAVYVFSLSSLFDVNRTGAGHQPAGYDQIMAIYEQYLVTSATIKVSFDNVQAAGGSALICGLSIVDEVTTSIDPRVYIENGNTTHQVVSSRGDGNNICNLQQYVDMAAAHGLTYAQYASDDIYRGRISTSPSEELFAHVWVCDIGTGDPSGANILVEIDFNCQFMGGKLNALS